MFANLSAYLTGLMYGFTGLQLGHDEPESWSRHPVRLPAGWRAVRIGRLWIRGRPWALEARAGDSSCRLTPLDTDGIDGSVGFRGQSGD
jgi:protein-glucosylgalactosylhydroxylysine glucosidase